MNQFVTKLKESKLFKDSFWAVFGNGFGYGILLISGIIIARFLGKDLYGEYGVVKSTMFTIAAFSTFGLGYTSTKYVADFIENRREDVISVLKASLKITFVSSSILALMFFVFAEDLSLYLGEPSLKVAFRFLGFLIIIRAVATTQNGILAGFKKFKNIAYNCIISGLIMLVSSIPLTYYFGLKGALLSLSLSQIINTVLNQIVINKIRKIYTQQIHKKYVGELLRFSFPVALQELSYSLCGWFTTLLLVKYSSLGEVGLYSASAQWNSVISFIPGLLYNVVLSHLSGLNDVHSHTKTIKLMLLVNFTCTFIPFLIVYVFAGWISYLYGESFVKLPDVMRYATFATIFSCCSNVFLSEFISRGKTWFLLTVRTLRDILNVIARYVLLRIYNGSDGAIITAIITVVSSIIYLIVLIFSYVIFNRKK